jgi:hypothetical protein
MVWVSGSQTIRLISSMELAPKRLAGSSSGFRTNFFISLSGMLIL